MHTQTHTQAHPRARTHERKHTRKQRTHTHVSTDECKHTYIRTHARAHTHTEVSLPRSDLHTFIGIQTYVNRLCLSFKDRATVCFPYISHAFEMALYFTNVAFIRYFLLLTQFLLQFAKGSRRSSKLRAVAGAPVPEASEVDRRELPDHAKGRSYTNRRD